MLSSGYGTLSVWDTGLEPAPVPGDERAGKRLRGKNDNFSTDKKVSETLVTGSKQHSKREDTLKVTAANQLVHQQSAARYV